MDVFSVRDLRINSSTLLKGAEEGRLSLITKRGRPSALAVPFDERLCKLGVNRDLALHLFEAGSVSLAKAAKIAGVSIDQFLSLLASAGIPAVDYPPEELDDEMKVMV